MALRYSLSARPINPGDAESDKKVFPAAQYSELIGLNKFAKHIQSHGSPFTRDVIIGVLTAAVDCLREQLIAGNKVNFGDLGSFYVSFRSEGVDTAEEFDPNYHIKHIYVHWERSEFFADLKNAPEIEWEYTLTHKAMADAKKQSKQNATAAVGGSSTGGDGGGSGSGGSDDPDPGVTE